MATPSASFLQLESTLLALIVEYFPLCSVVGLRFYRPGFTGFCRVLGQRVLQCFGFRESRGFRGLGV